MLLGLVESPVRVELRVRNLQFEHQFLVVTERESIDVVTISRDGPVP